MLICCIYKRIKKFILKSLHDFYQLLSDFSQASEVWGCDRNPCSTPNCYGCAQTNTVFNLYAK